MRTNAKRSVVWKSPDLEFQQLVIESTSIGEICRKLGHRDRGGIFSNIKRRIEHLNLNIDHFINHRVGCHSFHYVSKENFLQRLKKKTILSSKWVKKKLIEFNLIPNTCEKCGVEAIWNNEPLVLQLDHKNGDCSDNLLENLRLLCPNCHSQTPTFSMGLRTKKKYFCLQCKRETKGYGNKCPICYNKSQRTVTRPEKEQLEELIKCLSFRELGKQYGVSDNAVRKWCQRYGLPSLKRMVRNSGIEPLTTGCRPIVIPIN